MPLIDSAMENISYSMNLKGAVSYIDGNNITNNNCLRSTFTGVEMFDYIQYAKCASNAQSTSIGIAFYSAADLSSFISGVQGQSKAETLSYVDDIVHVPAGAKYARFTSWANVSGFYVKGIRKLYSDRGSLTDLGYTALIDCIRDGIYRSGAAYLASITDLPTDYDGSAFNLHVTSPSYAGSFCSQVILSANGGVWTRSLQSGSTGFDVFVDWKKLGSSGPSDVTLVENAVFDTISTGIGIQGSCVDYHDGWNYSNENADMTRYIDITGFSALKYSRTVSTSANPIAGIAFYTDKNVQSYVSGVQSFASGSALGYSDYIVTIPDGAKYARFTVWKNVDGFYVKGLPKNPVLSGLKLSLLGDSISALSGYIPSGNDAYYSGSNHGVAGVDQMWWKILCDTLGMTPLVIDAWSGSSVCYNFATDAAHSDTSKIPMCSDLRTGRLGTDSETPDVIIVAGGTNDWTYSKSTTTPIGDWDGKTSVDRSKVVSGTSTFMESYASLIQQLQTNYPNAIIVCASCFFTCRGTDLGCTHVNDTGHPTSDYNDAIEKVCKIMGVPYINIYDVGFNFNNYYPTYAEDSQTIATHPNSIGHRVIAKRLIDRLPGLVKQFYS